MTTKNKHTGLIIVGITLLVLGIAFIIYQGITAEEEDLTAEHLNEIAMFDAIEDNDLDDLIDVVRDNVDISKAHETYGTPLYYAISLGFTDIARYLINTGKDLNLNYRAANGKSALDLAREGSHADTIRALTGTPR